MSDISKMSDRELLDYIENHVNEAAKEHPEWFVPEYCKYFANVNDIVRDAALENLKKYTLMDMNTKMNIGEQRSNHYGIYYSDKITVSKYCREQNMEEEKKCSNCKWYGIFSCECPSPCRSDTKQFWKPCDNSEE